MRLANRKFQRRFKGVAALAASEKRDVAECSPAELDRYWNMVKSAEKADKPAAARHVAGELERRLDTLGARLREEAHHRLLHRRQLVDALAQPDLTFMPIIG